MFAGAAFHGGLFALVLPLALVAVMRKNESGKEESCRSYHH